ncbi:hypothetical protein [Bacillus sp. FSL R7-0166]|uniref:hypothetical protein n=1 Tax=Bacillus sp. FSL R7-0166 TaxID=2954561 RepID=UPI0030FC9FED
MNLSELLVELEEWEFVFRKWTNFTKEADGRSNLDQTDIIWKKAFERIYGWENCEDKVANELAENLLYTGELRRIHIDHEEVLYHNHYVSWTQADNLNDLYWFNSSIPHTIITAQATKDNPGISIKGFEEFMKKYRNENYILLTQPVSLEQEVIFPLQESMKLGVKQVK